MEPNYLFGLTKKVLSLSTKLESGYILDFAGDSRIRMGTPCIMIKYPVNEYSDNRKIMLLPFAYRDGGGLRRLLDNHHDGEIIAKVTQEEPWLNKIKQMHVDCLNVEELPKILDYVNNVGPLTLLISPSSPEVCFEELLIFFKRLTKEFKNSYFIHSDLYGYPSDFIETHKVFFALTFVKSDLCIPIYNPTKSDGIVLHGTTYYEDRSIKVDKLVSSCEFTVGFSNFTENIVEIDGQKLGPRLMSYDALKKVVTSCKPYLEHLRVKSKMEEGKEDVVEKDLKTTGDIFEGSVGWASQPIAPAKFVLTANGSTSTTYYSTSSTY